MNVTSRIFLLTGLLALWATSLAFAQVPPIGPSGPVKCMCYCGKYLDPPCSEDACKKACGYKQSGSRMLPPEAIRTCLNRAGSGEGISASLVLKPRPQSALPPSGWQK
jgi:hypothetical protein